MARRRDVAWIALLLAVLAVLLAMFLVWEPEQSGGERLTPEPVPTPGVAAHPEAGVPAVPEKPERVRIFPTADERARAAHSVAAPPTPPAPRTVTATVTDWSGAPVPGAVVQVRHANPEYVFDEAAWRWKGTTGTDGVTTVEMPFPGYYEARAVSGDEACLPVSVNLTGAAMRVTLRVAGAVTLTGAVRDAMGEAVADARVELTCVPLSSKVVGIASDDGTFAVSGFPIERTPRIDVLVRVPGRLPEGFSFHRDDLPGPPHLDIVLTDRLVTGRCIDAEGRPVRGAVVTFGRDPSVRAVSGVDGAFARRAVPSDATRALLRSPGHAPLGVALPEPGADGEVRLGDLVITAGAGLEGWVVDGSGRPVTAANVALHVFPDNTFVADVVTVDDHGRFVFEHVADGPHRVSVHAPGHSSPVMPAVLDGVRADAAGVRIVLPEYGRIELEIDGETTHRSDLRLRVTVSLTDPGTDTTRAEIDAFPASGRSFAAPVGVYDVHVRSAYFRDHVVSGASIRKGSKTVLRLQPAGGDE